MIEQYIPKFLDILYEKPILDYFTLEEIRDAFHSNQMISKNQAAIAFKHLPAKPRNVLYIGSWIGFFTHYLCDSYQNATVTELDLDERCKPISKRFNQKFSNYIESYTGDVFDFGKIAEYDTVVNLSCEHMSTEWYDLIPIGTDVVLQSNNFKIPTHTNTCDTLKEMYCKYPISSVYYLEETELNVYTRFTLAGKK